MAVFLYIYFLSNIEKQVSEYRIEAYRYAFGSSSAPVQHQLAAAFTSATFKSPSAHSSARIKSHFVRLKSPSGSFS